MSLRNHRDIRKYFETNEQGSTTYQYFWDALWGTCITTRTDMKAQERFSSLSLQLKQLEKGEQPKSKASTKREIMKIRAEMVKWRIGKQQRKPTKPKVGSSERSAKLTNLYLELTKKEKDSDY